MLIDIILGYHHQSQEICAAIALLSACPDAKRDANASQKVREAIDQLEMLREKRINSYSYDMGRHIYNATHKTKLQRLDVLTMIFEADE